MKAILNDQEFDAAQGLFKDRVVGEGYGRIGSDEPEGLDLAGDGGLDDVGIGKAAGFGDA